MDSVLNVFLVQSVDLLGLTESVTLLPVIGPTKDTKTKLDQYVPIMT